MLWSLLESPFSIISISNPRNPHPKKLDDFYNLCNPHHSQYFSIIPGIIKNHLNISQKSHHGRSIHNDVPSATKTPRRLVFGASSACVACCVVWASDSPTWAQWNVGVLLDFFWGVSTNTPKWMVFKGKSMKIPWRWMIWRYPYFRKPPYVLFWFHGIYL